MMTSRSDLIWLYTIRDGQTVRVRYDLALRVEVGKPEAWHEPPSKVNDGDESVKPQRSKATTKQRRYTSRRDIMREIKSEAMSTRPKSGARSLLIDHVSQACGISRKAAKVIVCRARKTVKASPILPLDK